MRFVASPFALFLALLLLTFGLGTPAHAQHARDTGVSMGPAPVVSRPALPPGAFGGGSSSLAFGVDNGTPEFVSLDLQLPGTVTPIGPVPQSIFIGAGDVSADGTIAYQIDGTSLYSVNTGSGTATFVANLGTTQDFSGLTYDPSTDSYFGVTTDVFSSVLYSVDVVAGTATMIGTITNSPAAIAIAATPSGQLYIYDIVDDTVRVRSE